MSRPWAYTVPGSKKIAQGADFPQGGQPVGVALWALTDEIVAKRIDDGDSRLAAVERKSGANMRIIDVVASFGGEAEIRAQIEIDR
jgi:cytolysin-activating lysine-acyltransferase